MTMQEAMSSILLQAEDVLFIGPIDRDKGRVLILGLLVGE